MHACTYVYVWRVVCLSSVTLKNGKILTYNNNQLLDEVFGAEHNLLICNNNLKRGGGFSFCSLARQSFFPFKYSLKYSFEMFVDLFLFLESFLSNNFAVLRSAAVEK